MSLNIKNERVHAMAREAARVTGKTQTGAIQEALERLLRDYGADGAADVERKVQAILSLGIPDDPDAYGSEDIRTAEDLYDAETGLPA